MVCFLFCFVLINHVRLIQLIAKEKLSLSSIPTNTHRNNNKTVTATKNVFSKNQLKCLQMGPTPLLLLLSGHFLTDKGSCSTHCPPGFFANETSGRCQECVEGCVVCKDSRQCQRCRSGLYLQQGACVVACERCLLLLFFPSAPP